MHLERDERGVAVVVKRFHHPGLVGAFFDGARARREHAAMAHLAASGLPVPRPLGVTRTRDAWELRQEAIEGARPLSALLAGPPPPPGGWRRLLVALGELLARLHTLGLEHGDLHPGNVLVDARGAPWLVDLGHARPRRADVHRRQADLALAVALAREALAPRTRLAFLAGYRAALAAELRPALDRPALEALEGAGRARRRAQVELGLNRWLRESSRVRRVGAALERRRPPLAGLEEDRALDLHADDARLRELWLEAARLHEHRLPTVLPARLEPGRARFERPVRGAPDIAGYQHQRADRGLAPDPAPFRDARGVYFVPRLEENGPG